MFLSVNRWGLAKSDIGHVAKQSLLRMFQAWQFDEQERVLLPFGFVRQLEMLKRLASLALGSDGNCAHVGAAEADHEPYTLTRFLQSNIIGTLRYTPGQPIDDVLAWIREVRPAASIAAWTVTPKDTATIASELGCKGVPNVTLGSAPPFTPGELRIGAGLEFSRTIQKYDLILFLGMSALRSRYLEMQYRCAERAHRFLLLSGLEVLTEYDQFLKNSYFGFEELEMGRRGQLSRPVVTAWLPVVSAPLRPPQPRATAAAAPANGPPKVEIARRASTERTHWTFSLLHDFVWNAPVRNRIIARAAKSLIGQHSCEGPIAEIAASAPRTAADRHVVVFVETLDHAASIAEHLQDWPIVSGGDLHLRGLKGGAARRLHSGRRRRADGRFQIVIADGIGGINWADVDVLLRADAGTGNLTWLADRLAMPEHSCRPLLLIDVHDRGNAELAKRVARRSADYRQVGWFAIDEDPASGRLIDYVKARLRLDG